VIGKQLGNYRLTKLLGEGGFAQVYLSEHIHLGTQAAVKVLTTKLTQEGIAQFRNEARFMMKMDHPHIVRVLDFGMQGNVPFLIMAYAPGGSLRTMHPRGSRLSLPQIAAYINQVASALQYLHDQRLIHRDVKPENMLVNQSGKVALSDFGIAVVAHSTRSLGQKADVGGTGVYMAPEQFQGKPRTASDQYALGIVAYEWLVGVPPFRGNIAELAHQHVSLPPRPLHEQMSISSEVEEVVLKALAKDPKDRFACVQDFAVALEQASLMKGEIRSSTKTKHVPSSSSLSGSLPQPVPILLDVFHEELHHVSQGSLAPTQRASRGRAAVSSQAPTTEQEYSPAGKGASFFSAFHPPSLVTSLPRRRKKSWWFVVSLILIIGMFLLVSAGAVSMVNALTSSFVKSSLTSASGETETTATIFLQDLKQQNYSQAYDQFDDSLLLAMTVMDFTRQAQTDDRCYGSIVSYREMSSGGVRDGQQSVAYSITRSKLTHPYTLHFMLQQDLSSGKWLIASYGDDLGPGPPTC
jgi:serine/threonine protein kinase